jgi:hypothetical protein
MSDPPQYIYCTACDQQKRYDIYKKHWSSKHLNISPRPPPFKWELNSPNSNENSSSISSFMTIDVDEDESYNDGFAGRAHIPMEDIMDHPSSASMLEESEMNESEKNEPPQIFENAGVSYQA